MRSTVAFISLISFYGDHENEIGEINGIIVVFGSCATAWDAWVGG